MPSAPESAARAEVAVDPQVTLLVREGHGRPRRLTVAGESWLIGRGEFCDLQLAFTDVPLAHSELHIQGASIWIEAAEIGQTVSINGKDCKRLALRDGDQIHIGDAEIVVRIGQAAALSMPGDFDEDLSQLSALEICERIEAEQNELQDYERRRLMGWEALLAAVEGVIAREHVGHSDHDVRFEGVLQQLHSLSDALAARTRQLAEQEHLFLESTTELKDQQERMARKLDQLLQQLAEGQLRASA